jgi:TetR/AcrR family transcriptional repressor of nem operon
MAVINTRLDKLQAHNCELHDLAEFVAARQQIRRGRPFGCEWQNPVGTVFPKESLEYIPYVRYVSFMPRPTKQNPELGDARTRLLDAALRLIRERGFAATSVEDLCTAAGVTKGSYFHHFKTKEALGVAAAQRWTELTGAFFAAAPYHEPNDPRDRVLAYVAFRKSMITGEISEFSCLVGTMAQEIYNISPDIRDACGEAMFGHTATLEADIDAAMEKYGISGDWSVASLARHMQGVLQGAFVLAKAGNDPALARESLDHLDRYMRLLFKVPD